MDITRSGSQPSRKGLAEWFAGTVRIDPLFAAHAPARAAGNAVTFEPGARTAWHTHFSSCDTLAINNTNAWFGVSTGLGPYIAAEKRVDVLP